MVGGPSHQNQDVEVYKSWREGDNKVKPVRSSTLDTGRDTGWWSLLDGPGESPLWWERYGVDEPGAYREGAPDGAILGRSQDVLGLL
jgi:hypothetical protein